MTTYYSRGRSLSYVLVREREPAKDQVIPSSSTGNQKQKRRLLKLEQRRERYYAEKVYM